MERDLAAPSSDLAKLAAPAMRALKAAGLTTLDKLAQTSEADLLALHGMGPNAMARVRSALKAKGLSFAKH